MKINLTINGKSHSADVEPRLLLVHYLRDVAGLTGTHIGCETSLCGACTVHVDGTAVRSCQTPISRAADKKITTVEGLSADGSHPVQQAWLEIDVPQCGYCQAGQMMTASALLAKNAKPSDADIDTAMNGNLCRCGTYLRIRKAVHRASTIMTSQNGAKKPVETAQR